MSESDYESVVIPHYNKQEVQGEIVRFSQSRWVAVQCQVLNQQGYPLLLRYHRGSGRTKAPLTITKAEEIPLLLKQYIRLRPRTFYASINVYKELTQQDQVRAVDNILRCTPTWDIDNTPEKWEATIAAAKEIMSFLDKEGVSKSLWFKWSGMGAHVHLHHRALSLELLQRIAPLDVAYAVVEYVNRRLRSRFAEISESLHARELNIENEIDLQRVFTCPLSLHRSLNSVAVCVSQDQIDEFTPDWTMVQDYRHWKGWDQYSTGEADSLAEKAYKLIGPYSVKSLPKPKQKQPQTDTIVKWLKESKEP